MKSNDRRTFLKQSIGGMSSLSMASLAGSIPSFLMHNFSSANEMSAAGFSQLLDAENSHRILVLIELSGGNDGLNTVIPWQNKRYYKARKNIAIQEKDLLKLNGSTGIGLHGNMKFFSEMFAEGKLAIVNNVGYEKPNRSHFKSGAIWQSGLENAGLYSEDEIKLQTGWLGRYFDAHCGGENNLVGAYYGGRPLAMRGNAFSGTSIESMQTEPFGYLKLRNELAKDPIFRKMQAKAYEERKTAPTNKAAFVRNVATETQHASDEMRKFLAEMKTRKSNFPNTSLGKKLGMISQLITSGSKTRVYIARIGGFDTHSRQLGGHARLWENIDSAMRAFMSQMKALKIDDKVCAMTFSEFGRQVKENGTQGTDHGAAAPMFIMNGGVKGGVYGDMPTLKKDKVHGFGGLTHEIDFRSVYRAIVEQFLKVKSTGIISEQFKPLPLFRSL